MNALQELPSLDTVLKFVADWHDPETGRTFRSLGHQPSARISQDDVEVQVGLTSFSLPLKKQLKQIWEERLQTAFPAFRSVSVTFGERHQPAMAIGELGLRAKAVVAVGSGKGGVGKSTIAASIACGLQLQGCAVGLMDADVYGPSIPHLLGLEGRPEITEDKKIRPHITATGMKVMSMGFLVPPDQAVVWRGPMLHGAITQFLRDTSWGELDYLIIDMPPGTGDIALTLSQLLPLTGAVVVCTPQDVALLDANKAIAMFQKVNIPLLGMVENMSGFVCPDCGSQHAIFGTGGARTRAENLGIPFLGGVPIQLTLRTHGDAGTMGDVFSDPALAPHLQHVCYQLVQTISMNRASAPSLPSLPVL
jgi:ATP-binding protein involved in chromosome partitioning